MDEKYKKKIEGIIRKAPRGDQLSDEIRLDQTPCPVCDRLLPCVQLICPNCQTNLPFCIATVRTLNFFTFPSCNPTFKIFTGLACNERKYNGMS